MEMTNRLWCSLCALVFLSLLALPTTAWAEDAQAEIVSFRGDSNRTLGGLIYKPEGPGPYPALIYDHGSAPGRQNDYAFERLGPMFTSHGWVFFAPYRHGQGLSAEAGPYILDDLSAIAKRGTRHTLTMLLPAFVCVLIAVLVVLRKRRA